MRNLSRFSVDAKLHRQVMWVGNLVGGHDPGAQWTEGVNTLAEAEHARLHFAALNVAGGDVVENDIAADAFGCFFRGKMLAALFQDNGEFQFVIQFVGQMLGINHGLVVADDGVDVLKEDDPGHHGMREPGLGGFFVVLAEVAGGVKELPRNDWGFELDLAGGVENGLAAGSFSAVVAQRVVEGFVRRLEASVAALEQSEHVGRDQGVGEALKGAFVLDISQVKRTGGEQVDEAGVVGHGTNAAALRGIFEGDKSHSGAACGDDYYLVI